VRQRQVSPGHRQYWHAVLLFPLLLFLLLLFPVAGKTPLKAPERRPHRKPAVAATAIAIAFAAPFPLLLLLLPLPLLLLPLLVLLLLVNPLWSSRFTLVFPICSSVHHREFFTFPLQRPPRASFSIRRPIITPCICAPKPTAAVTPKPPTPHLQLLQHSSPQQSCCCRPEALRMLGAELLALHRSLASGVSCCS
jgi:hypothetical protein